jgi:hypothetical protein
MEVEPGIYYFNFETHWCPTEFANTYCRGLKGIYEITKNKLDFYYYDIYNLKRDTWEIGYTSEVINILIETGKIKKLTEDDLMIKDIIE